MDFLPGFFQGITRVLVSHPFDYVKLYLQTNKYVSVKDFFKNNKVSSLYRGVGIPLLTVPIDRAIQFRIFESLNNYKLNPFLSGSICGIVSVIFTLPSSYVCNNYILNNKEKSILKFTKKIIKQPLQLYNGIKPEILRSSIGTSIYLGTYGKMREFYGNNLYQSIINGAIAGWSVWTITYPIDTIKVEQQLKNEKIINIIRYRLSNYGVFNFWKGITPIYVRTLPSSILGMVVYEEIKKLVDIYKK